MNDPGRYVKRRTPQEIEREAAITRLMLGLSFDERPNMCDILENDIREKINEEYVLEIFDPKSFPDVEGLTELTSPVIKLPDNVYDDLRKKDDPRARSTAAHELGHFVMHNGEHVHYARSRKYDPFCDPEIQADEFAAAFLMPAVAFKRMKTIQQAQQTFGVGYRMVKRRAANLGVKLKNVSKKKGNNMNRRSP